MQVLKGKNILLGISSGIAVYKVLELVKKLKSSSANVKIIMTQNAEKLIPRNKFECEVYTELFIKGYDYSRFKENPEIYIHIHLAKFPDVIILAPATANLIGKIVCGIADDLLTTVLITTKAKVFVCPAMNVNMYENKIVEENIKKLEKLGFEFIGPNYGDLACGDVGLGRLAEANEIYDKLIKFFEKKDSLKGRKVLVTAGALSEPIDPVRVITNKSSGKMGIAIANEAVLRGAEVTLIRGDTIVQPNGKIKDIKVNSAEGMLAEIKRNKNQDIIVHSAAVPDFKIERSNKKLSSDKVLNLKLRPTKKILDEIKKINNKAFVVGFKAEYKLSKNKLIDSAYKRLKEAQCDIIVANDVGKPESGFYSDNNKVYIIDKNKGSIHIPLSNKNIVAERIINEIIKRISQTT